LRKELRN